MILDQFLREIQIYDAPFFRENGGQQAIRELQEMKQKIDQLDRTIWALLEHQRLNRLHNDLDAYLYTLAAWSLLEEDAKPTPEDFGIAS